MGPGLLPFLNNERKRNLSINGLHLAAFCGFDRVFPLLIASFDVNSKDSNGRTALSWASKAGRYAVVKQLLLAHADFKAVDHDGCTSLHWAAESGHVGVVQLLIDAGVDVNIVDVDGNTALHCAACHNGVEVVQLLVDAGVDVNIVDVDGNTALHCAAELHYDKTDLQAWTDVERWDISNNSGEVPLDIALQSGSRSVYEILCGAGANPRSCGKNRRTILMEAAYIGNESIVKSLLEQNIDLEAKDYRGRTALMEACEEGNVKVVDMLLQHNARVDVKDKNGLTVLMKAMENPHSEVTAQLLHADLMQKKRNLKPSDYGAALLEACEAHLETVIKMLLENGATKFPEAHN
ncbi:hypothetical protein ACHAP5_012329, partial [Fusarium lateritium]